MLYAINAYITENVKFVISFFLNVFLKYMKLVSPDVDIFSIFIINIALGKSILSKKIIIRLNGLIR